MALLPLALPPGMYRNGTHFQAAGRWRDGSLVRWRDGVLQPVGGWALRTSIPTGNPPRGAVAWKDNIGERYIAMGTAAKLWRMNSGNVLVDITPAGFTAGRVDAISNTGFGGGYFGFGSFGDERADAAAVLPATTWTMDHWGQNLLACSSFDGKIYQWVPATSQAVVLTNAPTGCTGVAVTEERFVFALGAGGDPRKVQWSDRENATSWTPLATNQAGSQNLQTFGSILCAQRTRGETLILTDVDAHTATYVGPPFVYGFQRVGTGCGVVSPRAVATVDAGVFWMGTGGFFTYSGGAVQAIPCDVRDHVFGSINSNQLSKAHAVANAAYDEIWFFYASDGSGEVDRYAIYNYVEQHWATGNLERTTGVDGGAFKDPIWVAGTGDIYRHESGWAHGGAKPFVVSGPVSLGEGDLVLSAVSLIPDEKTAGEVSMSFAARFQPNSTERVYGPYLMTQPTDVRFTGRQVEVKVDALVNTDWRVGTPRLDVRPGGKR